MQLGNSGKRVVVGFSKGVFHGMASAGAAYTMGMKFVQWLVIFCVQMMIGIGTEVMPVLDKLVPNDNDDKGGK